MKVGFLRMLSDFAKQTLPFRISKLLLQRQTLQLIRMPTGENLSRHFLFAN